MKVNHFCMLIVSLIFLSCQKQKEKMKIEFFANGKKYVLAEGKYNLDCKITYDTFSGAVNKLSLANQLRHRRLTFFALGVLDKELKKFDSIFIYSWTIVNNELKKDNDIVFENYDNDYAGYESVIRISGDISARYHHGVGSKDKFRLFLSIENEYAKGSFSGEFTSDKDSSRILISEGKFENIPIEKKSVNFYIESESKK